MDHENSHRGIVYIGSDHAGFEAKSHVIELVNSMGYSVIDKGTFSAESVDYPDYGVAVGRAVAGDPGSSGIVICGTGIGISIAANKVKNIRAALCTTPLHAEMARKHNNANILAMGARMTGLKDMDAIVKTWFSSEFEGGRHIKRVEKIHSLTENTGENMYENIKNNDPDVFNTIKKELERQRTSLEMIASENFVSKAVLEASGNIMTNKYAEGYPGKRYYGGCECVDEVENLARDRAKELFNCEYANVQPHSGSQANMAVFFTLLNPGDTILGMDLSHGGHLTHGSPVNFSGKLYHIVSYGVKRETGLIDYDDLAQKAREHKPKLIIAGASAYSRHYDFAAFRKVADEVGAFLMADIAHPAGLVASGLHPSPIPYCDVVTTTTHKTLRGPRGGMILMGKDVENPFGIVAPKSGRVKMMSELYDSTVMPGIQGGPLMHIIAAKAVAFGEALKPEFKVYCQKIIDNAKALAEALVGYGFDLVSDGTDNHLVLIDLHNKNISGKKAETVLESIGITSNKNMVPFDDRSPFVTSGMRLGTPALTSRGFTEEDMRQIAAIIDHVISDPENEAVLEQAKNDVRSLIALHPLYEDFIL